MDVCSYDGVGTAGKIKNRRCSNTNGKVKGKENEILNPYGDIIPHWATYGKEGVMLETGWSTDIPVCADVVEEEQRKDKVLRFIRYARSQNIGWLALYACVYGDVDIYESLSTFCGIHTNKGNTERIRKDCVEFDVEKFRNTAKDKRISQRELAKLVGISRTALYNTLFNGKNRKQRHFVERCEQVLGLEPGSLIGGQNGKNTGCL